MGMWHPLLVPEQCSTDCLKHARMQGLGLRPVQAQLVWNVGSSSLCLPDLLHAVSILLDVPASGQHAIAVACNLLAAAAVYIGSAAGAGCNQRGGARDNRTNGI